MIARVRDIRSAGHLTSDCCCRSGLLAKAISRYEKFPDIWKNADEDLPELIDAKARLARLKKMSIT